MGRPLTQTEKLNRQNAKAIAKIKEDQRKDAELHEKVRRGEMTAGEALKSKVRSK